MEGREEGWLSSVLGDHLRKHLPGGFLGNVDFVDKIYGGNVGEYLTNSLTSPSLSTEVPLSLISVKLDCSIISAELLHFINCNHNLLSWTKHSFIIFI